MKDRHFILHGGRKQETGSKNRKSPPHVLLASPWPTLTDATTVSFPSLAIIATKTPAACRWSLWKWIQENNKWDFSFLLSERGGCIRYAMEGAAKSDHGPWHKILGVRFVFLWRQIWKHQTLQPWTARNGWNSSDKPHSSSRTQRPVEAAGTPHLCL